MLSRRTASQLARLAVGLSIVVGSAGCKWIQTPEPAPSIADTDETLSAPLRPPSEHKSSRWELPTLLDSRSREIERNLGY
jgi:hypothetical protein